MLNIIKSTSSGLNPTSFESEWLYHNNGSEWWYFSGHGYNENRELYSFEFTLAKPHVWHIKPFVIILSLTNLKTKKRYYYQKTIFNKNKVIVNKNYVGLKDIAFIEKFNEGYNVFFKTKNFGIDLFLKPNKPAVWNCDNGILKMGETNQTTYYYSFTNLQIKGTVTENNELVNVNGKGWIDKQGGMFKILDGRTHWESFSLRFFDEEEIMLLSFPQKDNKDGTYIDKFGNHTRLDNFAIIPTKFKKVGKMKFSSEWEIKLPKFKEQKYTIIPLDEGQMNMAYFEHLASIQNEKGEEVGLCFVKLLPGARNKKFKMKLF